MPKAGHRLALGMKLQKEVKNSQTVKKGVASKKFRVKKDAKPKVATKKWL